MKKHSYDKQMKAVRDRRDKMMAQDLLDEELFNKKKKKKKKKKDKHLEFRKNMTENFKDLFKKLPKD